MEEGTRQQEKPPQHRRIDPNATESVLPLIKTVLRLGKLKVVRCKSVCEGERRIGRGSMLSDPNARWQPRQARCQSSHKSHWIDHIITKVVSDLLMYVLESL